MSATQKKKVYQDFSKGLNDRLSAIKIAENEATEIFNAAINDRGILEKYKGYIKDGSPFDNNSDSFIRFLLNFKRGTTVDVLLMAAYDGGNADPDLKVDLKKTTGDGTYTTVAAGVFHKNFVPRGIVFNNFAIITNGSEEVKKYDNTTLSGIAAAPRGRYIEAHKNRVFIAATSAGPSTIYWSAVNDETVWDAAAFEPVYPQDNGTIISIKSFADSLIVLKNNGNIYQVVGSFDQDDVGSPNYIRRVDTYENIGIISERTPVVHNGLLYFLAETGLYSLDRSMTIRKVTFNLVNTIKNLSFQLAPSTSKTFTFDNDSEWTSGATLDGTRVIDGKLKNYFDSLSITSAKQDLGRSSVYIDASNNVHVAYVDNTNTKLLKYVKWLASDNSSTTETASTETTGEIHYLSLDVAPNGNVGIAYLHRTNTSDYQAKYAERTTSWQTVQNADIVRNFSSSGTPCISLRHTSGSNPRIMEGLSGIALYLRGTSGVWDSPQTAAGGGVWRHISLELNGSDNPRWSGYNFSADELFASFSDTNGNNGTWTSLDTLVLGGGGSFRDRDHLQLAINSTPQLITLFSNAGNTIIKRNHTTATSTTLVGAGDVAVSKGYRLLNDQDNYYHTKVSGGNRQEKLTFENTSVISNSTLNVLSDVYRVGDRGLHNNGRVFASTAFGANANELIVRRFSYRGTWTSPLNSDVTMTAWGTYSVTDQINNSATVTHEVKLPSGRPPPIGAGLFVSIEPGQTIQSPFTDNTVTNRITYVLGEFASPEIAAIIDNYTGAGVDAKQAVGISFDNELFYAVSNSSDVSNSFCLIQDIADSYTKVTYPISAFERFKGKLYAGNSNNGDLLILKQGYSFAGSSYDLDYQMKEDFLETIELDKDIYKIYVLFEVKSSGSFDFSYRLDSFSNVGGSTWQTTTVDQTSAGIAEIPVTDAKARTIQMRVQNSGMDEQLGIVAVVLIFGDLAIR